MDLYAPSSIETLQNLWYDMYDMIQWDAMSQYTLICMYIHVSEEEDGKEHILYYQLLIN